MTAAIRDNPARHRFEMALDGGTAFATYGRDGGVLTIMHTEVPAAINGRGHGSALVKGVLDIARAQGLKVVPVCPFVKAFIGRHPEYADLLK
ncbi:MAG TPA: GNAT family N-acetyltransferase [Pseudolabrys sp.]|nr:GNAT family N-acetyltransferase [Pseudolabrys sp.]